MKTRTIRSEKFSIRRQVSNTGDPYLKSGLGRRPDSIVFATDRQGIEGHPTPKPIKVWTWLVERMTIKTGQIIFDPFLGSGTTLLAAMQLNRICYAIEISPQYVFVSLLRIKKFNKDVKIKCLNRNFDIEKEINCESLLHI